MPVLLCSSQCLSQSLNQGIMQYDRLQSCLISLSWRDIAADSVELCMERLGVFESSALS